MMLFSANNVVVNGWRKHINNIVTVRGAALAAASSRTSSSATTDGGVAVALFSTSASALGNSHESKKNKYQCLSSSSSESQPLLRSPQLQKNSAIEFSSSASAHGTKTTVELLRAIVVFEACLRLPSIVKHADTLLTLSNKLLGKTITSTIVKTTFFRHFCAGENSADMKPVIEKLRQCNIGAILDYAAESGDGDSMEGTECDSERHNSAKNNKMGEPSPSFSSSSSKGDIVVQPPFNQPARVYDYKSESQCDHHVSIFKECIRSVRDVSNVTTLSSQQEEGGGRGNNGGFAALKVTALGNPKLLERMSTMIIEVKNLFSKFDEDGNGMISQEDFVRCYR